MTARGIVRPRTDSDELRILLSAGEADNALGVVEMTFPASSEGPPLHVHPTHGEGFYVLEGELILQIGEEVVTAGPGTWAFAPRETPHALANHSRTTTRLLCVFAPGGFERRFERMAAGGAGSAALAEICVAEAATRVVGPPIRPFRGSS
jgi:quercetin dioxygenase-like cupin family protein